MTVFIGQQFAVKHDIAEGSFILAQKYEEGEVIAISRTGKITATVKGQTIHWKNETEMLQEVVIKQPK